MIYSAVDAWSNVARVWHREEGKNSNRKKLGPKRGGKKKKLKIESRDLGRCPDWPTAGKMFHFFCCFNDEEIVVKEKKSSDFSFLRPSHVTLSTASDWLKKLKIH